MSTALFPEGLTRTAWDDLQYRCKQYDDAATLGIRTTDLPTDPAKGWVIRVADLITIGAMRHIADPENYEGQSLPGWTIKRFRYTPHIETHRQQALALSNWWNGESFAEMFDSLNPTPSAPEGVVLFKSLAFRDPDGKSAPVDATGLQGWTLYTGLVIAPKEWTEADAVKTRDDGQPVGDVTSNPSGAPDSDLVLRIPYSDLVLRIPLPTPAPQPPAVKVGDRVLVELEGRGHIAYVHEITPAGRVMVSAYSQSKGEEFWFAAEKVLEVLPPRPTEG